MLVPLARRAVTSLNRAMIPTARKVATRHDIGRTWDMIHGSLYFRYEKAIEKGRLRSTRTSRRPMNSYTAKRVMKVAAQPVRIAPNRVRMYRSRVVRNTMNKASRISPTRRNGSDGMCDTDMRSARAAKAPPRINFALRDSHRDEVSPSSSMRSWKSVGSAGSPAETARRAGRELEPVAPRLRPARFAPEPLVRTSRWNSWGFESG